MTHVIRPVLVIILLFVCAVIPPNALSANKAEQPLMTTAQQLFDPIPLTIPYPEGDFYFDEKIELGKLLFFDPRLSQSGNVSCHSCHNISLGGADGRSTSIGHQGRTGIRNSPTVFNSLFQIAQFWDGRSRNLFEQAAGPMTGELEMATSDPQVCHLLSSVPGYVELFDEAFADRENPLCFTTIREALAAFESTLITPNAMFDHFLRGADNALNDKEKQGLALFVELGCATCHMGINVGGNGYYKFGVKKSPALKYRPVSDRGRQEIITTVEDDYVFKSPSLRNVSLTAPYFHSGSAWLLTEAVTVMADVQLDKQLTLEQQHLLVQFLKSLTGEQPHIVLPALPPLSTLSPRPNS